MGKKLTYEFVKNKIEERGFKLLSKSYKNVDTKIRLKCPNNHIFDITYHDFQQGHECRLCSIDRVKTPYNYIKKYFEKYGYKLLSENYKNSYTKLKTLCPEGHIFYVTWNRFQSGGVRCKTCFYLNKTFDFDFVKNEIEKEGYKILYTDYINVRSRLKLQCPKGHVYTVSFYSWRQGSRCQQCFYESLIKDYTPEELNELDKYKKYITDLSNRNYRKYKKIINPKNLKRGKNKYHLDHIFSIMEGFRRNIDPEIIANPYNLQMLWWKKNIIKLDRNWQSEKMLYQSYCKFKIELKNKGFIK